MSQRPTRTGTPRIRHADLDIADGEFLVLVGPSGCGKSTLLRLIAGLETPTSGRVFIGGDDVTAVPPQGRDLAMVFQSYALYPHMSVRDNLAYGLKVRRTDPAVVKQRVASVAAALDLEEQSGGGRRAMAVVLVLHRRLADRTRASRSTFDLSCEIYATSASAISLV